MKRFKVLAASTALSFAVVLGMTGCSEQPNTADAVVDEIKAPVSVSDLMSRAAESYKDFENCRLTGNFKLDITASVDGEVQAMPVSLDYAAVFSNTQKAYISAGLDVDLPGDDEDVSEQFDAYISYDDSSVEMWYKTSDSDTWFYSTETITEEDAAVIERDTGSFNIDGDFSESDKGYIVTQTFKSIFESDAYKSAISDLMAAPETDEDDVDSFMTQGYDINAILESVGTSFDDIESQLGKAKIEYVFDKSACRLTELNLSDFTYSISVPDTADVSVSLSLWNIIFDYNKVAETEYTVSAEIVDSAVDPWGSPLGGSDFSDDFDYYSDFDVFETERYGEE